MKQGKLTPDLTFREAFEIWIEGRVIDHAGVWSNARFISKRTEHDLRQYARAAGKFFDQLKLSEIHAGHLREYQKLRATNPPDPVNGDWYAVRGTGSRGPFRDRESAEKWARPRGDGYEFRRTAWEHPAGGNLIRKEVGTVVRVMMAAGAWTAHHDELFEPLATVNSDVPRAMTPKEQHAWLHVAASREQWRLVYWWSIIALQTTCAPNEMRSLRLGDIYLEQGILTVRSEGAKNKFRIRSIPLQTKEIVWALDGLMARSRKMGATGPHHYLFPKHITGDRYDPSQPMTVWGIRKPWEACRKAAGLEWLTPYDLRHTAITRLAESGEHMHVIMSLAGHVSRQMQHHYIAISMQAKRRAVAAAWLGAEMPFMSASASMWGNTPQLPQQPESEEGESGEEKGPKAPGDPGMDVSTWSRKPGWMRLAV